MMKDDNMEHYKGLVIPSQFEELVIFDAGKCKPVEVNSEMRYS